MNIRWKRALYPLLAIAMLAALLIVPAAAADKTGSTGGKVIDVWDFAGQTENKDGYVDNITAEAWTRADVLAEGTISKGATTVFGDLSVTHSGNDRVYSNVEAMAGLVGGNKDKYLDPYDDGYAPLGGWYCNGTGSATSRCVVISNVQPGDKLVAYINSNNSADVVYHFEGQDGASEQQNTVTAVANEFSKFEFVAETGGSYKIWGTGGKLLYQRLVRIPAVDTTGTITVPDGFDAAGCKLKFVNRSTGQEIFAALGGDNTFTAALAPGYTYSAMLTGAVGWGVSAGTKTVTTTDAQALTGLSGVALEVVEKPAYTYTGRIEGLAPGYDTSKLKAELIPEANIDSDKAFLTINASDLSFSANLDPNVAYKLVLTGANDYEITSSKEINLTKNTQDNIVLAQKALHTASGKFIDLEGNASAAAVTAISFEILSEDDTYTYPATVTAGGYTAELRDGDYEAVVTADGYSVIHHVVMKGGNVEKDMLLVPTAAKPALDWVGDIYVGCPDKSPNYATMTEAVDAVSRMGVDSEDKRVTVHIAPGVYREQLAVKTPYITFVNDEPAKGQALLTWYYGIGYVYYSSGSGDGNYYSVQRAYDKYEKKIADRWGATVRVLAEGFRAENIVFENSFNRYITEEEIADGVEVSGMEAVNLDRTGGPDVQSNAATERAAAMCVEAGECEFYNCEFYSSQDTLYTNGKVYFKDCIIEGQTDFIFGDTNSRCVFDNCAVSWKGYSTGSKAGYLTALRTNAGEVGYLFRDCTITANPDLEVTPGYFGRPWGPSANVIFFNTKLERDGLIAEPGWASMSGNQPEKAQFKEYNTTMAGSAVDTSGRVAGTVMTDGQAAGVKSASYLGAWMPLHYVEDGSGVTNTDGPTAEKVTGADGSVTITVTDKTGEVLARVELPATIPALDYTFEDVPAGHWAEGAVNTMAALGVISGVSDESPIFDMNSNITRGAMTQILFSLSQGKEGKTASFSDVAEDAWYADAVAWAAEAGVVAGYSDNSFAPDDPITREQLVVMLYRYADLLDLDLTAGASLDRFTDGENVSSWANSAISWAVGKGLVQGKDANNLDPSAPASRAETTVMLVRFISLMK